MNDKKDRSMDDLLYLAATQKYGCCNLILYPQTLTRAELLQVQLKHMGFLDDLFRNKIQTISPWECVGVREEIIPLTNKLEKKQKTCRDQHNNYWLLIPIRPDYSFLNNLIERVDGAFIYDRATHCFSSIKRKVK